MACPESRVLAFPEPDPDVPSRGVRKVALRRCAGCGGQRVVPLPDCPQRYRRAKRQGHRLLLVTRSASRRGALGDRTFVVISPRANPFLDLLVRYSFASVERCNGRLDTRNLPFVDRKVLGNCLGREERSAAARVLSKLFQPLLHGGINAKCKGRRGHKFHPVIDCVQYNTTAPSATPSLDLGTKQEGQRRLATPSNGPHKATHLHPPQRSGVLLKRKQWFEPCAHFVKHGSWRLTYETRPTLFP
jgi:hypothetical protein